MYAGIRVYHDKITYFAVSNDKLQPWCFSGIQWLRFCDAQIRWMSKTPALDLVALESLPDARRLQNVTATRLPPAAELGSRQLALRWKWQPLNHPFASSILLSALFILAIQIVIPSYAELTHFHLRTESVSGTWNVQVTPTADEITMEQHLGGRGIAAWIARRIFQYPFWPHPTVSLGRFSTFAPYTFQIPDTLQTLYPHNWADEHLKAEYAVVISFYFFGGWMGLIQLIHVDS